MNLERIILPKQIDMPPKQRWDESPLDDTYRTRERKENIELPRIAPPIQDDSDKNRNLYR